jgi:hypothetical protein
MAEHKVQGGSMLLFIDPNGGTDYDVVVCLTSVSKSDSVTVVDASSACGPDKSPGTLEISYSFEGQHLQDPDTGKISGTDLRQLLRSETTLGWMISPEIPEAGDEIEEGTGYLSELSSTYAFDSVGTFTGTLQPYGTPTISIEGGGGGGGFTIGQDYQGGKIAWIDGTGLHGIIIAASQISGGEIFGDFGGQWSDPSNVTTGATATLWGQGAANSSLIIASTTDSQALAASNFVHNSYNDWTFGTLDDMLNVFSNAAILNISESNFATSSEITATDFIAVEYSGGVVTYSVYGKGSFMQVLAVRYF